jgi:DNA-binding NarL/FixJ family response regulator
MVPTSGQNGSVPAPTRVLIVEDHAMIAQGLKAALEDLDDLDVVGLASTVNDAERMAGRLDPDVVVLDYRLPDGEAPEAIRRLAVARPAARVLVLTAASDQRSVLRAIEAGAAGYLLKDQPLGDLVAGIRAVREGNTAVSPAVLPELLARLRSAPAGPAHLTAREIEVLQLLADGRTNADVARQLHLSVNTVRNHVQRILNALDAHSKLEAVSIAMREGVIKPPDVTSRKKPRARYTE